MKLTTAIILAALTTVGAVKLPDIKTAAPDLKTPEMVDGAATAGKRVKQVAPEYKGTQVFHTLYLRTDWKPGAKRKYPVIVEYAGNGPYRNRHADISTGKVEGSNLGYGISGGKGFIWLCLPYVNSKTKTNQRQWWGDVEATVEYCKKTVPRICEQYGGEEQFIDRRIRPVAQVLGVQVPRDIREKPISWIGTLLRALARRQRVVKLPRTEGGGRTRVYMIDGKARERALLLAQAELRRMEKYARDDLAQPAGSGIDSREGCATGPAGVALDATDASPDGGGRASPGEIGAVGVRKRQPPGT